jgi:hypothetical protein
MTRLMKMATSNANDEIKIKSKGYNNAILEKDEDDQDNKTTGQQFYESDDEEN